MGNMYVNLTTADTIQETLVYAERLTGYYGDIVDNGLIRHKYYTKDVRPMQLDTEIHLSRDKSC